MDVKSKKSIGGVARALVLSPEERSEIAKKAADSRWSGLEPKATHEGEFKIGDALISAVVLADGTRLLSQATFLRALGRSRSPKAGFGVSMTVDRLPSFLQAEALKPFINNEITESSAPVSYKTKSGKKSLGYDAKLLPLVAEVYLKMRDFYIDKNKSVPKQYQHIIWACDILMRGLARIGIIALVDEATGYQEVRDKQALQKILDQYLTEEKAKWAKTFPDDFYKKLFNVRGIPYDPTTVKRPGFIGHDTNNIVYDRMAPGILQKLQEYNPKSENGRRKDHHHQFFTDEYGIPELKDHIKNVMFLMDAAGSNNWKGFLLLLNRAAPKQGSTLELDLG